METCYRHPGRETGVSCSNCGKPICPDCMTPTSVGMRCPDCAQQKTPIRTMRSMTAEPIVTYVIIAMNAIAFLASGQFGVNSQSTKIFNDGALFGPAVADGDYWRLVTSGFLHAGLLHIGFNMYLLYLLGTALEPQLGNLRFGLLYFGSLLAGSTGALIVSPNAVTVGASGAVFGLMGAIAVMQRVSGVNPFQTDIGMLILFNLGLSFVLSNVSIGGHIGGLLGGALIGFVYTQRVPRMAQLGIAVAAMAVFAAVGVSIA